MCSILVHTLLIIYIRGSMQQRDKAEEFLEYFNKYSNEFSYNSTDFSFRYYVNMTDFNLQKSNEEHYKFAKVVKEFRSEASRVSLINATADIKRQFRFILENVTPKNPDVSQNISSIYGTMEYIFNTGGLMYNKSILKSVVPKNGTTFLSLDEYLVDIMRDSNDPDELLYVWKGWRDSVGPKLKNLYAEYVRLNNIGAKEHGYTDAGAYKRSSYEVKNLMQIVENYWIELKPFYEELHAYVRYHLSKKYKGLVNDDDAIPAHLLGNMWAQSWGNIFPYVKPFKSQPPLDITPELETEYDIHKMFKTAEEFFMSIGWQKLPKNFWDDSMFIQPSDRLVGCHASAWDFGVKREGEPVVRVQMCTKKTQEYFMTIHHELGHIYYYLLYWDQPYVYRYGANPGFHEAVGDTITLSVQTPAHLKKIGLLKNVSASYEADINFLLKTALIQIPFLPFAYLMDKWMWDVYSGDIKTSEYNQKWWDMRLKYQGLKSPVKRTENDFDPGSKSHISGDTPYIRYFFASILQYTFHKHGCRHANNKEPLHKCSIHGSKKAGKAFRDMLKLGKSKTWPEALKQFTGSDTLSVEPMKEYFAPLIEWLKKEREEKRYEIAWKVDEVNSSTWLHFDVGFLICFSIVLCLY